MKAIIVRKNIGLGDAVQFTSLPENYFAQHGERLIDLEKHACFDFNPFVVRETDGIPDETFDLWELYKHDINVSYRERTTWLCNAESHLRHFKNCELTLGRPRLYRYEEYPFKERHTVLLHVRGKSHGQMPTHVVKHVLDKYGVAVRLIGLDNEWDYNLKMPPRLETRDFWQLAEAISRARMYIGVDSGPAWIARCYPDVLTKIVRLWPNLEATRNRVPLECCRLDSHWDDRTAQIHTPFEQDAGFTWSYRRL